MAQQCLRTRIELAQRLGSCWLVFCLAGCGFTGSPLPAGSIAGRAGLYDYSPSVIQTGSVQQAWWCGSEYNPSSRGQFSDTIQYQSLDFSTHQRHGPYTVLAETPGAWDSVYTCNPKVIQGYFANPLGDGETFTYAMYYVATNSDQGIDNFIGVAFSNDGISWKKYPHPVIAPATSQGYGVGQPVLYNSDQYAAIRIFYEDNNVNIHHVEAVSRDGVHFSVLGTLTTNGLDIVNPTWGDMAFDPASNYWYAAFNSLGRDPSTTGGVTERGSYSIELYRITDASLLTGATPWERVTTVDTNLEGYEAVFLPGFVRDGYGNLMAGLAIQMYTSISNPPPPWNASPAEAGQSVDPTKWDIGLTTWTPGHPLLALNRYLNATTHEVTTGWIDPHGGFSLQATLGHLYESPQAGATIPLYGCKATYTDYFVSPRSDCEGFLILGLNGYAYSQPAADLNLVALYRCKSPTDHFVSTDPKCEGQVTDELLGYALP